MWVKQRLLAEGPPAQVLAATARILGEHPDTEDGIVKLASTPFGIVLALLLLDHDTSINSSNPANTSASQKTPAALRTLFALEKSALRETTLALAELSKYFAACSSRVNIGTARAGRQELETLAKIRRSLNRQAGLAISLKKFIDRG